MAANATWSSSLPAETEVLIVGAGPAGMTLSASLCLLGVDHVLVDRTVAVQPGTKAAGVQPHTLEYLERLGVAGPLIADGVRGTGFLVRDADRSLVGLSYETLDTPYPYLLLIGQQSVEEHLQRRLLDLGGTVHREHRLLTWQDDFPGVTATLAGPDGGLRAVHARYLVGCDGVHSRVRGHSRIAFPGTAPEQLFAVADVRFAERPAHADTTFFFSPHGLALISELPGAQHRVVAAVPAGSTAPSGDDVEKVLRERTDWATRVSEVVAASTYRVQQRVADRFGDGPVFLCGDAAHTHSPAGAQGMNTGIQDAANLAWKLHEVVNCGADAALLESYHRERHPVAEELVRFTSQITALATLADPDAARLRNDAIAAAATAPGMAEWIVRRLSQLDIAYPGVGTAACDPAGGALVGRRLPPSVIASDGLAWTLAVPDRTTRTERIGRISVHAAPGLDTTVLVRPDGYVAAAGVPADPAVVVSHLCEYARRVSDEPTEHHRP